MEVALRFQRLKELFDAALELESGEWPAFAATACGDDPELGDELLRLLACERDQSVVPLDHAPLQLDRSLRQAFPDAFVEGLQLGPFRLVEALGEGGMGRVFRAVRTDDAVDQQIAIKLVRSELLNPALLSRFSAERRMLAALDHPGICRFVDAGALPDGTPYVAMELVRGTPLLQYCDDQRLTLRQRLELFEQLLAAVEHAHHNLIVHRDIKSGNVLVGPDGLPKLLDFGIAKSLSDQAGAQTHPAERFLTPFNAAPEQLGGEPTGVGCDVYALGLLAYELLCGLSPFDLTGLTRGQIEHLLLRVPPPPMSQRIRGAADVLAARRQLTGTDLLARRLAGDLDGIVSRCLRKMPSERYPGVADLSRDIRCVLEHRPVSVRHGDFGYRARKFVERHRLAVALSALLLATLLSGTALIWWQALDVARQRDVAILERDRASQLVELLRDAFVSADPARMAGADVRVREVLHSTRPRVEAFFEHQPALYASLADTLAEVHLDLALHEEALELAERAALALRRSSPDRLLARRLTLLQGRALLGLGRMDQAEAALRAVRAMDAGEAVDWMVAQGNLLNQQGREGEARELLRRAVALTADRPPDDDLAAVARWQLAGSYSDLGQHGASLDVLEETIVWQRRGLAADHPRLTLTRLRRVDALRRAGRLEQSANEATEVLSLVTRDYGPHSAMAARAHSAAAMALRAAGQPGQAMSHYEAAIGIWRETVGVNHANSVIAQFNLAQLLAAAGDVERALLLFEEALTGAEQAFGPEANRTAYMRITYAELEARQHNYTKVLELLTSDGSRGGLAGMMEANRRSHLRLIDEVLDGKVCTGPAATSSACRHALDMLRDHAPRSDP